MLYVHAGATAVTLDTIRKDYRVPTVKELRALRGGAANVGNRWKPIHHAKLIDELHAAASRRGYGVVREAFALSPDTHDLFGFMQFGGYDLNRTDMAPVLGFRSSNAQRFALRGVTGAKVFICDNGAICGEFLYRMKHTTGNVNELPAALDEGMTKWASQADRMTATFEALEGVALTQRDADHFLMEGVRQGAFANSKLAKIDETYRAYETEEHPHHTAFAPRNAWSLYNAVTEVAKDASPIVSERMMAAFPRVVAKVAGFEQLLSASIDEMGNNLN